MIYDIKRYAIEKNIPIIMDAALSFIKDHIMLNNVESILEIGSAIGYSAISFAMIGPNVDTIERDIDLYNKAVDNVSLMRLGNRINLIYADALTYENITKKYDLIFIDAAKAQYINFFNKYQDNLANNGIIICDNLNFHNLDINTVSRSTRQLITKINNFKEFLKNHEEYETIFYDIADGMSVSMKK